MLLLALPLLAGLNAFTMLQFWRDKQRARHGLRRIPEVDLLILAALGGSPGAFAARHLFRHKTRKQPFSSWMMLIAVLQAGGVVALLAA